VGLGRELREARIAAGLRQEDVARAAGVSRAWVSQIERGLVAEVGIRLLAILLATVGLDLSARAYPASDPIRDAGQWKLLSRFRRLLPEGAPWRTEVPFPRGGDLRSWDAFTRLWGARVGIEAEMRLTDWQATERRLMQKLRDGGVDSLILVLSETRHNRLAVRSLEAELQTAFPLQGRAAKAALRKETDPGCNLLVLV
jgi:transcriptional regulator with XRE-family HTH domain